MNVFSLIIIFFFFTFNLFAVPAIPELQTFTQPNTKSFDGYIKGHEYQNWTETEDGYSIVKDIDGYWKYAEILPNGTLGASSIVVDPDVAPPYNFSKNLKPKELSSESDYEQYHGSKSRAGANDWSPLPSSPTGNRKLLIVLLSFTDKAISTTTASWYSQVFDTTADVKSVTNYFSDNSYGALNILPVAHTQGGSAGVISITSNQAHNNDDRTKEASILSDAIPKIEALVDLDQFDTDGDNILEPDEVLLYFVFAGYEKSGSAKTPSSWAHATTYGVSSVGSVQTDGGRGFKSWALNGEYNNDDNIMTIGVMCHELGHQMLMIPDLYDTASTYNPMGYFSVMASGSWGRSWSDYDASKSGGTTPVAIDAWSREYIGWDSPTVDPIDGLIKTFQPALTNNSTAVKFTKDGSDTEYYLVENRYASNTGVSRWDSGLETALNSYNGFIYPANRKTVSGLLVQHIDITVGTRVSIASLSNNDINKYTVGIGGASGHAGVIVVEANSTYGTIGDASSSNGVYNHLFYFENNPDFNDTSSPKNSKWYDGSSSNKGFGSVSSQGENMTARIVGAERNISYSTSSLTEAVANDGSIGDTIIITLTNDTFTGSNGDNFVSGGKISVANLPAGLTAVANRDSDTQITVSFTGNAGSHSVADDIANLTFTFLDGAFTNANASLVKNYLKNDISISFTNPNGVPAISYSKLSVAESVANDGSISETIVLTLINETFTGNNGDDFVAGGKVVVTNLSAGLTAVATRDSTTQITISFTGNAINHENANDVANLTFTFANSAFSGGVAINVTNYAKNNLAIDFTSDSTAPLLQATLPLDGAIDIAPTTNIVLTFSEPIQAGVGNIKIVNDTDGATTTIPIGDGQITIVGAVLTINPTVDLLTTKDYHIEIDNGAILDSVGNSFAGISNATTLNFKTLTPIISILDGGGANSSLSGTTLQFPDLGVGGSETSNNINLANSSGYDISTLSATIQNCKKNSVAIACGGIFSIVGVVNANLNNGATQSFQVSFNQDEDGASYTGELVVSYNPTYIIMLIGGKYVPVQVVNDLPLTDSSKLIILFGLLIIGSYFIREKQRFN